MNQVCLAMLLASLFIFAPAANAQVVEEHAQRAQSLYREVRCPVCSGQSIAGSDVLIAQQLREFVDLRIAEGDTNAEIKTRLVAQYGQEILFEPDVRPSTLPLWILPWLVLVMVGFGVWRFTRREKGEEAA